MTPVAADRPPVLPAELQGVWRRISIALAGQRPVEEQAVVRLQAPTAFAEVQVPLVTSLAGPPPDGRPRATATAFAGTTDYREPRLLWHREVDLDTARHEAASTVAFDGDDLVETGTFPFFGAPLAYTTVWRRELSPGPVLALEAPGARMVRVGSHAITVVDGRCQGGTFAACHRVLRSGWEVVSGFGVGLHRLPAPPVGEAWERGDAIMRVRGATWGAPSSWTVVEATIRTDDLPVVQVPL